MQSSELSLRVDEDAGTKLRRGWGVGQFRSVCQITGRCELHVRGGLQELGFNQSFTNSQTGQLNAIVNLQAMHDAILVAIDGFG